MRQVRALKMQRASISSQTRLRKLWRFLGKMGSRERLQTMESSTSRRRSEPVGCDRAQKASLSSRPFTRFPNAASHCSSWPLLPVFIIITFDSVVQMRTYEDIQGLLCSILKFWCETRARTAPMHPEATVYWRIKAQRQVIHKIQDISRRMGPTKNYSVIHCMSVPL